MTSRLRAASLALIATVGLISAPLLVAGVATAAVPSTTPILFFSNDLWTDVSDEDATMHAALAETGATITTFDGGDGSGAAWSAALTGNQVLVIPESDIFNPGGTAIMSVDAATAVKAFVVAGGRVLLGSGDNSDLLSFITDIDYAAVWSGTGGSSWDLQIIDPTLPATLTPSNGTDPIGGFDTWSPELLAGVVPLYVDAAGTQLAVAQFPVGAGFVGYFAYDWYPGTDPEDISARALWNVVLQALANVPATPAEAEPALAATGVDSSIALTAGAGFLLLGATALVLMRTRRVARAL